MLITIKNHSKPDVAQGSLLGRRDAKITHSYMEITIATDHILRAEIKLFSSYTMASNRGDESSQLYNCANRNNIPNEPKYTSNQIAC
jgi:hypothetical protein